MIDKEYTLRIRKFEQRDRRLGRHVVHDSRSLRFQVKAQPRSALQSVRHYSMTPTMDQGNYLDPATGQRISLGSCTGNSAAKNLTYGEFWSAQGETVLDRTNEDLNQHYAVGIYSEATAIDPWEGAYPPDDTGSNGLSVAKIVHRRGLINGYLHATSLDAVLTALQTQAVITGTAWYTGMFYPADDGRLSVTGSLAGGHEYTLDEVDMENERVWLQNSWGPSWGIDGRAYLTFDDYEALLADWGDATIFVPITEPAPEPEPIPEPEPEPAPVEDTTDTEFASVSRAWLSSNPFFYKKTIQAALRTWLERKNL